MDFGLVIQSMVLLYGYCFRNFFGFMVTRLVIGLVVWLLFWLYGYWFGYMVIGLVIWS